MKHSLVKSGQEPPVFVFDPPDPLLLDLQLLGFDQQMSVSSRRHAIDGAGGFADLEIGNELNPTIPCDHREKHWVKRSP
jgi:hypothetical protein